MTTGSTSTPGSSSTPAAPPSSASLDVNAVDIPHQLAQLSEGWLELESDPGLFSSLISDFGCRGVQVEEIYDLERPFTEQQPTVYGFIFLFNVIEERRNRFRSAAHAANDSPSSLLTGDYLEDEEFLKKMFFAYQKVPNSCATHAILSVLMNCKQVDLGAMLRRLKEYTRDMSPEIAGYAISNMAELARAHNNHAAPSSSQREQTKQTSNNAVRISQRHTSSAEAFHFVSFVPINGRLIEIDGLKDAPIDHGLYDSEPGGWTEKFRKLMRRRIETPSGVEHDIRYNLMAVIPSKYEQSSAYLKQMQANRLRLLKIIQILEFSSAMGIYWDHNYSRYGLVEAGDLLEDGEMAVAAATATASGGDDEVVVKIEDPSIEWPDPMSLVRCPGQIRVDIEDERIDGGNFTLGYAFPKKVLREVPESEASQCTLLPLPPDDSSPPAADLLSSPPPEEEHPRSSSSAELNDTAESVASGDATDTASQASSSYNHQLDDDFTMMTTTTTTEQATKDGGDETMICDNHRGRTTTTPGKVKIYDRKFFICKFECRPEGGKKRKEEASMKEDGEVVPMEVEMNEDNTTSTQKRPPTPTTTSVTTTTITTTTNENESKSSEITATTTTLGGSSSAPGPSSTTTSTTTNTGGDQAIMASLLGQFRTYKGRSFTFSEFESTIKPHILKDLILLLNNLNHQIHSWSRRYKEEEKNQEKFRLDDSRRVHDYDHFITTFLSMFFEQGLMDQVLDKELYQPERSTADRQPKEGRNGKMTESYHVGTQNARLGTRIILGPSLQNGGNSNLCSQGQPLANLSNMTSCDLKAMAESCKLDYETTLFFPANFAVNEAGHGSRIIHEEMDDDEEN